MALVMVLAALAVMALLLVALFQGATHQTLSAASDAAEAREKLLADSAVALVIGQIAQASTQPNEAWISQPGLLRVYSTRAVRAPVACYKLYSTATLANLVDTSGNLNFLPSDVPANWSSEPAQYTDLNAPAQTIGGGTNYPILDPAATNTAAGTAITGVSIDAPYGVQMPVAWLYELQDGTLGPAANATAANPIVARMAFWADDDTCKVNINTAGCGSGWNTPRVYSTDDVAWSTNQPAAGEYSAYPGHPANTSLAEVLGGAYSPQQTLALSPRYAWGGSQFGTQATTPGESVPAKLDRLYASVDELRYSTNMSAGQRVTNAITPSQLETARFVLTAHSIAPETTLLGEPRIAIWPVADSTTTSAPRITAWDAAITNAATVGLGTANVRSYFFQRHNAMSPTDDLNASIVPSNAQLFSDLIARGNESLPGYGTTLASKYSGAAWTQLMLEIVDYIRCINAVDPTPSPFVPYAAGSGGAGLGFVDPLTTTYTSGANTFTLRAFGRAPTLSSLTLVFYVCGFGLKNGTTVDYEQTPDNAGGANWVANFLPASANWANVTSERVRAFVIPCTFVPACGYPEFSDPCTIQIKGLDALKISNGASSGSFGFTNTATFHPLSDALEVTPADRAWGGNDGPLAWRAAALDAQGSGTFSYALAGTNAFAVTLASSPTYSSATKTLTWPSAKATSLVISSAVNLTVLIQDPAGNTLQTLAVTIPAGGLPVPNPKAEFSEDGAGNPVYPSYYMTLKNRVLLTQTNRAFAIQPGDMSRTFQAATDLRVIAGLTNVPSAMFAGMPSYTSTTLLHVDNLRYADGTAVEGVLSTNSLAPSSYPWTTTPCTWTNWCTATATNYAVPVSPPCSCPTATASSVYMVPVGQIPNGSSARGDWDTGPGFCPDGALINLPDAGTSLAPATAYFSLTGGSVGAPTQRTPNALVPSPVIFGSLPAGINAVAPASSVPWRSLLFCPYPLADTAHPGFGNASASPPVAPDHLVLDNFWMPVIEPYPISTCLATDGKINLNDQIAPFTWLHRSTALHAVLNSLRIPAISVTAAGTYKSAGTLSASIWNPVDENLTIAQIESRFTGGSLDAYLSESEICTVPLVPRGVVPPGTSVADTQTALEKFWLGQSNPDGGLTGDNLRELPYAQLYSRLTTRSNSYTVHVRVQVLKKLTADPNQNVWNEGTDVVLGDWRGSYQIERYLDPAAAAPQAGQPLGPYKFRILSARRFAP